MRGSRSGFTLVEVIAAVAVAALVITGGLTLITASLRALREVTLERELLNETQNIYLEFMTRGDMPDRGEKDGVKWEAEEEYITLHFETLELHFRRLTVEYEGREMMVFLPAVS